MKFFHVYNEECFPGLEKNGFLNRDSGFKIQHCFAVPRERQFNQIARPGGTLHSLLRENGFSFYVDRIAGGITYYPYVFDQNLIHLYEELLAERFLGFQLHESASNIQDSDWVNIRTRAGEPSGSAAAMARALKQAHPAPDGTELYDLSYGTPEEYAAVSCPQDHVQALDFIRHLYTLRMEQTGGHLLPVDSYYMLTQMQNQMEMQVFMPEVGAQIPLMRQQVALARGMARASGKKWGTYYECWRVYEENGSYFCCMPCYHVDPVNEWYLTQQTHQDDFTTHGENGGSSRLLQNRIYYYALMSGADYFSEEWGLNCSYTDMQTFDLSPYGQVKRDFIRVAETLRGLQAVTPVAIILPVAYSCMELPKPMDLHQLGIHRDTYMGCKLDAREREYFGHVEDVLKLFFSRNGPIYGNEGHVMTNSRFGDLTDILYADAPRSALQRYDVLIDATPDGSFARSVAGSGMQVLESRDLEQLARQVEALTAQILPVSVDGLHWLVSTAEDGRRFLSIFNNEGNRRTSRDGDVIDHAADRRVHVTFRTSHDLRIFRGDREKLALARLDKDRYQLTVPAADFAILEF